MVYMEKNLSLVDHTFVTFTLNVKSLLYSKKWLIYVVLSLAPFIFSILNSNRLGSSPTALEAFISVTMDTSFGFFYVFGVLLLALPFTSDEITDHIMDLYLIRPIHKEVIFFTRYIALVLANTILNSILIIFYYIYFYLIDNRNMVNDLGTLGSVIIFFFIANLLYSALFLGIGFIGSKGFGIGVFVALIELFFLNFLFLVNDPLVPRTNLRIIAHELIGSKYPYDVSNKLISGFSSYDNALIYVAIVTILFLLAGLIYVKTRDFD